MSESPIEHVSDTAIWVATYRARETERPDALFRDPLAKVLAGTEGERIASQMAQSSSTEWAVVIRTKLIDDMIQGARSQGIKTVINLGAGLDTRPYRMDLPSDFNWVEIDYSRIIDFKEDKLKGETPRCRLERIPLDLANVSARQEAFRRLNEQYGPAVILTEGVLSYLSVEHVADLAKDLHAQPNFKFWIMDYFSPRFMEFMRASKVAKQMQKAPFQFNPPNWKEFFQQRGWQVDQMKYMFAESRKLNRDVPGPWFMKIVGIFMPPSVKRAYSEMTGYALMKRT